MDWVQLLDRFGLPTAFLIVITWILWQAVRWSAKNVVEPLVSTHMRVINSLQESMERQTSTMEEVKDAIVKVEETQRQTVSIQREQLHGQRDSIRAQEAVRMELAKQTQLLRSGPTDETDPRPRG